MFMFCMQCWGGSYWNLYYPGHLSGASGGGTHGGHSKYHQQHSSPENETSSNCGMCFSHCGKYDPKCVTFMGLPSLKEQYILIHDAVLEKLTCGDTEISAENLRHTLKEDPTNTTAIGITRLQKEFMVKLTFTLII